MTYEEKIKKIVSIYVELCSTQEKNPVDLFEDGKLCTANMHCPSCAASGDYPKDNFPLLKFDFSDHSFHCDECDSDFFPEEIADGLLSILNDTLETIEGLSVVLPFLVKEEKAE